MVDFSDNKIFSNGKVIKVFRYPVYSIITDFSGVIVVLLDMLHESIYNKDIPNKSRQIYGIDYDGKVLWQLPEVKEVRNKPFTGMSKKDDFLSAYNWIGLPAHIDPYTGKILKSPSEFDQRPW